MTDRASTENAVRTWMEGYLRAWRSNDPADIGALFTDDGEYRTEPWLAALVGPEAIIRAWLERADEPDSFDFTWEIAGIDGSRAFIDAETRYREGREYSNLWVIDLAPDGRARAFTEWWMDQNEPS